MNDNVNFGDLPTFKPDPAKVLAAICFLIEEAGERGEELTQYDIVKSIFKADERHLNDFGRPITYDNYIAMEHGPVGDMAIDMLNSLFDWAIVGLRNAPWQRSAPIGGKAVFHHLSVSRDRDALSGSDERMLLAALVETKAQGFKTVRQTLHRNAAYRAAYKTRTGKAAPMDWRLIGRCRDDELIDDLVAYSHAPG